MTFPFKIKHHTVNCIFISKAFIANAIKMEKNMNVSHVDVSGAPKIVSKKHQCY